jgi:RNA polymerase sigma-70 factor (ECF subfamily)
MTGPDGSTPSDAALVADVVEGSHEALAALYDRHADSIFATASRLTSDRGLAEEVVQETFLALWNRAETFDPSLGSLPAWLHTVARNRTVDRLRALGRRPTTISFSAASGSDASRDGRGVGIDSDALDRVLSSGSVVAGSTPPRSPEMMAALAELRGALQTALATMPEDERQVIVLAYAEDLSQSEIAERLGWPLGTVKTRTRRGLARLRGVLASGVGPEFVRYLAPVSAVDPEP